MKKYIRICSVLLALAACPTGQATISINLQADKLKNSNGTTPIPTTSLFLLVADTNADSFGAVLGGASTSTGTFLNGGDDLIVFRGNLASPGTAGVLDVATGGLTLGSITAGSQLGVWNPGDPLALFWFPTLTLANTTIPGGTPYGRYTNPVSLDGSQPWITPANGVSNYNIFFLTSDGANLGPGTNPSATGNATLAALPIPEPSSTGYLILTMAAYLRRRRAAR